MASEARLAANRANARKSTGPKTQAGKEKSRRNALKHGLSGAGTVLRRADAKKVARRISDWRAVLCPVNPLEDTLVERAAIAAVRCESAVKQEAVARSRRITRALSRLEARKRKEIAAVLELLQTEPGRAGRKLQELKRGVAWLIDEWKALADRLRSLGYLCCADAAQMLRLLGIAPELPYPDDAFVLSIRKAFLGALPELDLEAAEAVLGLSAEGLDDASREAAVSAILPEPAEARGQLQAIVAEELSRLDQRQAELATDRSERLERAETIRLAQVGLDTRSVGLHRYERDEELSLHRNLNELIRTRKQEPDVASIARWEKMGKKFHRRWDGYQWVPNPEWQPSERVAGGGWRVAGGREGGLTEVELSTVTGSEDEPQATPRVAGFSALREPGAPQPQLQPADPDPMAPAPASAARQESRTQPRNEPRPSPATPESTATSGGEILCPRATDDCDQAALLRPSAPPSALSISDPSERPPCRLA